MARRGGRGGQEGPTTLEEGRVVGEIYLVERKLGEGGFGAVYKVRSKENDELYAMKVEGAEEKVQVLKMEVVVLSTLAAKGGKHVCRIEARGREQEERGFNWVVMTLVGPSLQDLKKLSPRNHFSLSSALRSSYQCLEALEDLHGIGYLHRDIKPGNFAVGRAETKEQRTVFILDFGLARKYIKTDGQHRAPRSQAGFRGTVRYAPLCAHRQREQGRKDDLEVWFYQLTELTVGRLPWRDIGDIKEVGQAKERSRRDLTLFNSVPPQYRQMIEYIDNLQYWDTPVYQYLKDGIDHILKSKNLDWSERYDWEKASHRSE